MDTEEIKKRVHTYILQAEANPGIDIETNKFDFKYQWYDLKGNEGINEFLKDTTAIVNSYGGGDGFIVIGFNPKSGLKNAEFKDSKLRDKTDLSGIITSRVDRPFNIDEIPTEYNGHKISIIHLPPSLDKPHVIRKYEKDGKTFENEIFVRHATGAKTAKKHDLDLMYSEKRSIIIDKQVNSSIKEWDVKFSSTGHNVQMYCDMFLENVGIKKLAILDIVVTVKVLKDREQFRIRFFNTDLKHKLINANDFLNVTEWFICSELDENQNTAIARYLNDNKKNREKVNLELVSICLVSGEKFPCRLTLI